MSPNKYRKYASIKWSFVWRYFVFILVCSIVSIRSDMLAAADSRSITLQVEYKNTQEKLGSFGIILSGPTGMIFPDQSCDYRGSDYGEFKYDQNKVILGGFSDGIGPGILMICRFDLKTEFSEANFSITLHVVADPKRVSLLNKLSAGTDFVIKDITLQTTKPPTPPIVTISSPTDDFKFNQYDPLVEIKGTIADPGNIGIDKVELKITYDTYDGIFYLFEYNGRLKSSSTFAWIPTSISDDQKTWTYSIEYLWVPEKVYSVTARVTDKAGHQTTKTIHVTYTDNILVSGAILDGYGKPIPNVQIVFTRDKIRSILYTDDSGKYSWPIPTPGWSGTVTLDKPGYTFSPSSRVLTSISTNLFNNNFSATAVSEPDAHAIIMAGGDLNDYLWPATKNVANLAYTALRHKGIKKQNIQYFSMDVNQDLDKDSISDIDALASSKALEEAILRAGGYVDNKAPLIIYLVGHGLEEKFYVTKPTSGSSDIVTATNLKKWLDDLQNKTSAKVILIIDACYSGSFMKALVPPAGIQRIVIASTQATERAYFSHDGSVSFSNYFWNNILQQKSLQASFNSSAKATLFSSTRETPQHSVMDANSDGQYNENIDPKIVSDTYLGESPNLKEVFPEIVETISNAYLEEGKTDLTLWVQVNLDPNKIARVWGVVTPPGTGSEGQDTIMLDQSALDLTYNQTTKRYETLFKTTMFGNKSGQYAITFFAQAKESDRWVSLPKSTTIQVGKDMYESDNTLDDAKIIVLNSGIAQHHNTHALADVDWVTFYAIQGVKYVATAKNLGKNANLVLERYDTDGVTRIDTAQTGVPGEDVTLAFSPTKDGIYFIKVKQYSINIFGANTEYDLTLSWPAAPIMIPFTVLLTNELNNKPIAGAKIKTGENETALTDAQGRFTLLSKLDAPDLTINDGYQIKLTGKTLSISARPVLDVDKNGSVDATDGVLILRKLTGASTIDTGVLLPDGQTNNSIVTTINAIYSKLNVDQNSTTDATDGVLILRKLTGASTLDTGVVLPDGQNNSTVMTAIETLSK